MDDSKISEQLLIDIRDSLQALPERFIQKLERSRTPDDIFGERGERDKDRTGSAQQKDQDKPWYSPQSQAGAQITAMEQVGFSAGRFMPMLGELAGYSVSLRNLFTALDAMKGKDVSEDEVRERKGAAEILADESVIKPKREPVEMEAVPPETIPLAPYELPPDLRPGEKPIPLAEAPMPPPIPFAPYQLPEDLRPPVPNEPLPLMPEGKRQAETGETIPFADEKNRSRLHLAPEPEEPYEPLEPENPPAWSEKEPEIPFKREPLPADSPLYREFPHLRPHGEEPPPMGEPIPFAPEPPPPIGEGEGLSIPRAPEGEEPASAEASGVSDLVKAVESLAMREDKVIALLEKIDQTLKEAEDDNDDDNTTASTKEKGRRSAWQQERSEKQPEQHGKSEPGGPDLKVEKSFMENITGMVTSALGKGLKGLASGS